MKKWFAVISVLAVAVVFLTGGAIASAEPAAPAEVTDITVTFDAGDVGSLLGESEMLLACGDTISTPPEVSAPDGSRFVGWYLKGDPDMRIINIDKLTVYKSITLTAAYQ